MTTTTCDTIVEELVIKQDLRKQINAELVAFRELRTHSWMNSKGFILWGVPYISMRVAQQ